MMFCSANLLAGGIDRADAAPVTIEFEGALPGDFTGPITEDGFIYSKHSGSLLVGNTGGNPGAELLRNPLTLGSSPGILSIVRPGGEAFTLQGFDFALFKNKTQSSVTVTVQGTGLPQSGFPNGLPTGQLIYTPATSPAIQGGPYSTVSTSNPLGLFGEP